MKKIPTSPARVGVVVAQHERQQDEDDGDDRDGYEAEKVLLHTRATSPVAEEARSV